MERRIGTLGTQGHPFSACKPAFPLPVSRAQEIAVLELRPFDAEAFKSRSIDYATIERDEEGMVE
jgi:hypothetical protein